MYEAGASNQILTLSGPSALVGCGNITRGEIAFTTPRVYTMWSEACGVDGVNRPYYETLTLAASTTLAWPPSAAGSTLNIVSLKTAANSKLTGAVTVVFVPGAQLLTTAPYQLGGGFMLHVPVGVTITQTAGYYTAVNGSSFSDFGSARLCSCMVSCRVSRSMYVLLVVS